MPHYDPHHESYRIRAVLPTASEPAATVKGATGDGRLFRYWWPAPVDFNQGDAARFGPDEGRCTGFAACNCRADGPVTDRALTDADAPALFAEIRAVDRADGRRYAEGATSLAMAKAMRARGWLGEFRWGFTLDELLVAVRDVGPVLVGTNFYADMMTPDDDGVVRVGGRIVGGHEYVISGVSFTREQVRIRNSWGKDWGFKGMAFIGFDDMARLIREDGDVMLGRELPRGRA